VTPTLSNLQRSIANRITDVDVTARSNELFSDSLVPIFSGDAQRCEPISVLKIDVTASCN
jgi:hypothetical protein